MEFLCTAASEPSGEGGARNNKRLKPKKKKKKKKKKNIKYYFKDHTNNFHIPVIK